MDFNIICNRGCNRNAKIVYYDYFAFRFYCYEESTTGLLVVGFTITVLRACLTSAAC